MVDLATLMPKHSTMSFSSTDAALDVDLGMTGGAVDLGMTEGAVDLRKTGEAVDLRKTGGAVDLRKTGGAVDLGMMEGAVDFELLTPTFMGHCCKKKSRYSNRTITVFREAV